MVDRETLRLEGRRPLRRVVFVLCGFALLAAYWWFVDVPSHRREHVTPPDKIGIDPSKAEPDDPDPFLDVQRLYREPDPPLVRLWKSIREGGTAMKWVFLILLVLAALTGAYVRWVYVPAHR